MFLCRKRASKFEVHCIKQFLGHITHSICPRASILWQTSIRNSLSTPQKHVKLLKPKLRLINSGDSSVHAVQMHGHVPGTCWLLCSTSVSLQLANPRRSKNLWKTVSKIFTDLQGAQLGVNDLRNIGSNLKSHLMSQLCVIWAENWNSVGRPETLDPTLSADGEKPADNTLIANPALLRFSNTSRRIR